MRFLSVNADCFLIELASLEETLALYNTLQNTPLNGIKDLVPAAKTILVFFNEIETNFKMLVTLIQNLKLDVGFERSGQAVVVPIRYDGEDLAQVAELQGLSVADVIRKHQQSVWNVAFIGFAPGFAYMSSPDRPFTDIPRLTVPRKKIPAGSLGLAGRYSGIYPKDSPGGWQLIGTTTEKMWDLARKNPALLLPGMTVHFKDVTHRPTAVNVPQQITSTVEPKQSVPLFSITMPSLQMLIQDEGRFNQTKIGVGMAGAMDVSAMHSANRLVGNPTDTPVIEVLNGGLKAKLQHAAVIAVTGAISNIRVKFADGQTADFASYQLIDLDEGDEFHIQPPTAGLRNYVAVRGGIEVQPVLNSASFDSLAMLGPEPLKLGDTIYQGQIKVTNISINEVAQLNLPKAGDLVELDIVMGPRTDWFEPDSIDLLCQQEWLVTNESNRVGLRLSGAEPLTRKISHELESEGACIGALQIPPSGQPVLFMNDHPLTGGYPVIAAVAKHHWNLVAQIPAGCRIQFKKIAELTDFENKR
ncbi:TIGR00370 family protein [Acinetobacter colistiniresistens]|uniref:TIGR00370 family protein n=1 Tax=Acinetobacter colistiniresistens TaxID=280145 RepID=N9R830_9GAMM|nr:urea amidolyase family protein [Acinetobacter colistiniresistens]ENX34795.1 TIGR00370 family protein [Acinetobacter colistiniresistens]